MTETRHDNRHDTRPDNRHDTDDPSGAAPPDRGSATEQRSSGDDERCATTTVSTPIGALTVVASSAGVRRVRWPDEAPTDAERAVEVDVSAGGTSDGPPARAREIATVAAAQLEEYFAGTRRSFHVALDAAGTPFQRRAWEALARIPYGRTVTYGEQAAAMGDPRTARAVGAANGRNPIPIIVGCHRVIGRDGSLTGFAGGLEAKRHLLDLERRVDGLTLV
ncbi:methylated-DNA--[protein]-cysteine S-methyltransferase [Ilumatobacter sp.]|uniref:methylated-DNA--[protein]-cysteine S-methyltransferase n=1 Tax=Ilumatobacter sp. TaxID=1967498 RepID=UPI003B51B860